MKKNNNLFESDQVQRTRFQASCINYLLLYDFSIL